METTEAISQRHYVQFLLTKNPELDGERIHQALQLITEAHRNQFRKSGTPYTEHPLEVAKILANLKLDTETILAGLLHDVVEDTEIGLEEVKIKFGAEVAFMVDAVTKISEMQVATPKVDQKPDPKPEPKPNTKEERKIATYRKFLVSMAKDPRVIMIKLADRLHNLRTLHYMKPEKRKEIAKESLEIYAPLTHRFGLHRIKWELEDLSLKHIDPEGYKAIIDKLQQSRRKRESYISSVIRPLEMKMALENLECNIQGRPKHVYSIYQKTRARNCSVDDLFDLFAIRIIVNAIPDCYMALGYVHNLWTPLQSRFKDYIATPKPNLYQSLHTTVIGPEGKMVEVQIRTRDMEQTAENGFAAHWAYKMDPSEDHNLEWLQNMVKAQSEITDSKEFFEFLHMDLKPMEIVIFTPQGDPVSLPSGATVLDLAFAVHTELGMHCIGAKVDGQVVGIDKILTHGNTVHILRNPSQEPSQEWLTIAVTHKAKNALRRKLRSFIAEQAINIGKAIYERELTLLGVPQNRIPSAATICAAFQKKSLDEFYESVGNGNHSPADIENFLEPFAGDAPRNKKDRGIFSFLLGKDGTHDANAPLVVDPAGSSLMHFARCCSPVPGDRIAGVLVPGKGIEIHKDSCRSLKSQQVRNIIAVEWHESGHHPSQAKFEVNGSDREGLLEDVVKVLRLHQISIQRASIVTVRESVRDRFTVKVYNLSQLEVALQAIRQIPNVKKSGPFMNFAQGAPSALPQQVSRNREFHCKMRNRQYERAYYLFRKLEGLTKHGEEFSEHDQLPILREFASCVETCLEHANASVFYGKRQKLQSYSKDRRYGILQEEYILVHFLQEVLSSVLYVIRRIETDQSLQGFADHLEQIKGGTTQANGFVDRVLESLTALKDTTADEFSQIYGVLAQRYQIGNKLFSLIQDLQRFR